MNKVLTLAMLGALAVTPALAAGAQSGQAAQPGQQMGQQQQPGQWQQQQLGAAPEQALDENLVRDIQQQLQAQGHQVQVDGVYGPETRQALQQFQQQQGLQPHGQVGLDTLAALGIMEDIQQAEVPEQPQQQRQQIEQQQQQLEQQQEQLEQRERQLEQQERPFGQPEGQFR